MKIKDKKITVLLFMLIFVAVISNGCGSSYTAADYVSAILSVAYYSDAVDNKCLDMKMEDVNKVRQECADKEAQFLEKYFNMENVSDKTHKTFVESAKKISASVSYTVSENGDNKVIVSVKPLVIHSEKLQKFVDDFNVKRYVDADKSYTEDKFVEGVVKIIDEAASDPEYADEVKIEINVDNKGGNYKISDEDLAKIDSAMFKY